MICEMIREVADFRVIVAYICVTHGNLIDTYAARFAATYRQFQSGYPHDLIVICNGGPLAPHRAAHFTGFPFRFHPRPNDSGWDISAYQDAAGSYKSDFIVCLGESVYFNQPDWLGRMVDARLNYGEGMYGFMATHAVRAHLNTTAFACDTRYLVKYPPVQDHGSRYEFEHGKTALWRRIAAGGGAAIFVTREGCYEPGRWREETNILNSGDQSSLLLRCNHTDRFEAANPESKRLWSLAANIAYR